MNIASSLLQNEMLRRERQTETDRQTETEVETERHRHVVHVSIDSSYCRTTIVGGTDRQAGWQTDRYGDIQINKQTETKADTETYINGE